MSTIKTNIKATNFDLTEEITDYVAEKISNVENYLKVKDDTEIIAQVEIEKVAGEHHKHGNIFRAEINLHYEGQVYRAEETREDIFVAIEETVRVAILELKKSKSRQINFVRRGGAAIKKLLRFGRED
jgi:ribosomal subunit interface protein